MNNIILLVEDDDDAREIARVILELNGFKVIEAVDAVEAANKFFGLAPESPGVIVLDLSIPPSGGKKVMQQIKKDPAARDIPILAFTALSSIDEQEALKREGFDDVIPKPCRPEEIVDKVKKYIKE